MQNFSVLACLEVAEKFVVVVVGWWSRTSLGFIFCRAEQYIFIYFLNVGVQWMSGEWIVYCVEGVWWNLGGVSGGCNVNIFLLNNQLFLTKFFETFKPIYFCVCMYPSSHLNLVTPR